MGSTKEDRMKAILVLTDFIDGHYEDDKYWGKISDLIARASIIQLSKNIKDKEASKVIQKAIKN